MQEQPEQNRTTEAETILEELAIQVEVNRRLSRELIELRLELARARERL